jgi:hypothetical protein
MNKKHTMMKRLIKVLMGAALPALAFLSACSDVLDEQPRSIYEPGFFKTVKGVEGGLTSMYAHLRYIYGQGYYYNMCLTGTDEATYAESADQNFKAADHRRGGLQITPSTSRADVLWGAAFSNINTANGVIENATEVGLAESLIAEARFFRAFDYFALVQTFGGVPLDLGAGKLKFNTSPSRRSVRDSVYNVYTQAIFPDLLKAVNDLPENPRFIGGVTKTVARLYLAKAYLTYGWWLENPQNIPTYPLCDRVDPDGHDAQWYFQQAYDMAVEALEKPGPFRLQPTFYDVNLAQNDRNMEILLYADHTETSEFYNGASLSSGTGSAPGNFAGWMVTWNYTNLLSTPKPSDDKEENTPIPSVQREAAQALGRPWTRMCPTIGVLEKTFVDKTRDSRYDGTFTTVYRANWPKGNISNEVLYNANYLPVKPEDAILTFLPDEELASSTVYPIMILKDDGSVDDKSKGRSGVGAGVAPGRADYVISPRAVNRLTYPGLWKLGPYRTDNGGKLGSPNAESTRPFNIAKFSELYLIAAEAAVKGAITKAGKSAYDLVNVLRARAGMWRWDNAGATEKSVNHSAEMVAATPTDITIDYILDERSREFYGEGYRWYDLVRTQTWHTIAASYEICCGNGEEDKDGTKPWEHTPKTFERDIQKYHYLHPIPQGQIDGMEMPEDEKQAYQNPGY